VTAVGTLLRDGAILWADGKLDWDYTSIGNSVLAKAKSLAPDNLTLLTLPTTLPARGERPPATIRVGGKVQQAQLIQKVTPSYPPTARDLHIEGIVQMTALIGLDGEVLYLHVDAGPAELIPASLEAVRQWEYKPTMLNGKPCYIVTRIDVTYTLSPQTIAGIVLSLP
jgi:outer membrane biosynthesis protein TonB